MNGPLGLQEAPGWATALSFLILVATLVPWVWMARRLVARRTILRYEPRRPVPWGALELGMVVLFLFGTAALVSWAEQPLLSGWAKARYSAMPKIDQPELQHGLVVVLAADPSLLTLGLCFLAGVVVAPVAEEFFFRLLVQGWLEKWERRFRRRIPALRRLMPGLFSILISSALFAVGHYRPAEEPDAVQSFHAMVDTSLAFLLTVLFGVALVKVQSGATRRDLGFVPARFWGDVRTGLVAALAVLGPIYLLQDLFYALVQYLVERSILPEQVAADPVSIFFFAAALGLVYCRTHRIVPGITLHMALNLSSLLMAWFVVRRYAGG
jgi:membrane protease YdiL (CAAX protease family)